MSFLTYLYACMVNYLFGVAPEHSGGGLSSAMTRMAQPPSVASGSMRFLRLCLFGVAPERLGGGLSFAMTRMAQPPSVSSGGLRFLRLACLAQPPSVRVAA